MCRFIICIGIILLILLLCLIIGKIRTCIAVKKVRNMCNEEKIEDLDAVLKPFGFFYCERQDIFTSRMNAWQREMGYCKEYDETAVLLSMVISCEPIYFEYDNRLWLIECWKGQYGMTTGAEVGVYVAPKPKHFKPGDERYIKYSSVSNEELLDMRYVLRRNKKHLLARCAKHWWLTAFDLGIFSCLRQLSMSVQITFPNDTMCMAFYEGLLRCGYRDEEIRLSYYTVSFTFDNPRSEQPIRKWRFLRWIAQQNNKRNCRIYEKRTRMFDSTLDKVTFLKFRYPLLYRAIFRFIKGLKKTGEIVGVEQK